MRLLFIWLLCCLLTVAIETPFMALFGYRRRDEIFMIVCVNVLTNLSMNLLLYFFGIPTALIAVPELLVLAAEYLIYRALFGASVRLFLLTLAANVISCGAGLLIFG